MIAISLDSFAISKWYKDKQRGWYWFEDKKVKEQLDEDKELFTQPKSPGEAVKQIAKIRKTMDEVRAYAILTQDEKQTARYIALQKQVLDISERFSLKWQDVLRLYPHLDESINNPVSGRAKEISQQIQSKEEKSKIENFGKEYGLLVITRQGCPYCHAFTPVLKEFAEAYNFTLLAMSQDGNDVEGIKQIHNPELLASLPIEYVPAVFAVKPDSEEAIILSSGMMSLEDFKKRVLLAIESKEKVNAKVN
jgi:conjugal transfer pilus assembly protein TraF